jgi:hypothetical protein
MLVLLFTLNAQIMKTTLNQQYSSVYLLICVFFSLPAQAESSCTKQMFRDPFTATNPCLSEQVEALNSKIERRYAEIISGLPEQATPETTTEYEGLSKSRMNEVYTSWKNYQGKYCSAQASSYSLTRRNEDRAYLNCFIAGAKQHLKVILKKG